MHRKKSSTIANAGNDTTTVLPSNAITLDGGSTDPENNITSYRWVKISGPFAFSISNVNAVQTQVSTLVQGIYLFELKVTDAGGLSSKDTIQVTVISPSTTSCGDTNRPHVNARLIPVGTVSQARYGMAVASAGNKILFAGGSFAGVLSSRVDV